MEKIKFAFGDGNGEDEFFVLEQTKINGATYILVTDSEEDLLALRDLERSLPTLKRVEVLPYHTLGLFKWKKLGITYSLNGVPTPTDEEVRRAEEILEIHKY